MPGNPVLERLEREAREAKKALWVEPNPIPPCIGKTVSGTVSPYVSWTTVPATFRSLFAEYFISAGMEGMSREVGLSLHFARAAWLIPHCAHLVALLSQSPLEGCPCWANCARRASTALSWGLREHRTDTGALPTPHGLRAQGINQATRSHLVSPASLRSSVETTVLKADPWLLGLRRLNKRFT